MFCYQNWTHAWKIFDCTCHWGLLTQINFCYHLWSIKFITPWKLNLPKIILVLFWGWALSSAQNPLTCDWRSGVSFAHFFLFRSWGTTIKNIQIINQFNLFRRNSNGRSTANPCLQYDGFLYTKISCLPAGRGFVSELAKPELNLNG